MREKRKENSMFGDKEGKRKEKKREESFFFFFLEKEKNLLFGLEKERCEVIELSDIHPSFVLSLRPIIAYEEDSGDHGNLGNRAEVEEK